MARIDVCAYVVRGVMIDAGFHRARRRLLEAVRGLGVRGAIITHWHEDHAGNVQALADAGVPVLARPDTIATLRARPSIRLYRRLIWGHPPRLTSRTVVFDEAGLRGVHTPGHAPDHQIVWDARTRTIFSGDLWLGVRASILHEAEDPYQIVESLRVARALQPERMFDAHRGEVANPIAAIDAKIEWLLETLDVVARRLNEGWSEREIVRRILGGEAPAAHVSGGDYSRGNFVRAVRRRLAAGG
jgi:glyoxylase-like metal-dependent hydrolase (beta-lactamase superfamily II)